MNQNDKLRNAVKELLAARARAAEANKECSATKEEFTDARDRLVKAIRAAGSHPIVFGGREYSVGPAPGLGASVLYEDSFGATVLD